MSSIDPKPVADSAKNGDELAQLLKLRLLDAIPRVLCLLQKNPLSKNFGSFDRKFWQYKILDFNCGMSQELILPLAYVWQLEDASNPYYQNERVREFIVGAFECHRTYSHSDGSLDDYFPFERAYGATAYSTVAMVETAILTGLCNDAQRDALLKSGEFLASYKETGDLANHTAIGACALSALAKWTGDHYWKEECDKLVDHLLMLQHAEGWLMEYEGCDLGYQTTSVEFLARVYARHPTEKLRNLLQKLLAFIREFQHPDGSIGGEYGSRNTFNFYPGGFAVLSSEMSEAAEVLGGFLRAQNNGRANHLIDDSVFGHALSSYVTVLSAAEIRVSDEHEGAQSSEPLILNGAGIFRIAAGPFTVFGSLRSGGVIKVFQNDELTWSDTGLAGRLTNGRAFCQNQLGSSVGDVKAGQVNITGQMETFNSQTLSSVQMILLRMSSIVLGWWPGYSNLIRAAMQRVLILAKKPIQINYQRTIRITADHISITDVVNNDTGAQVDVLYRTTDCTNIHVVTSNAYQPGNLLSWEPLEWTTQGTTDVFEKVIEKAN